MHPIYSLSLVAVKYIVDVMILRDGNNREEHPKIWQHRNRILCFVVVMLMVISFKMCFDGI